MRIAIDLTALAFNFSGIERYALNVASRLIAIGKNDRFELLFCNEIHHEFKQLIEQNNHIRAHVVKAGRNKIGKLMLFQWKVPRAFKRIQADCYLFPAFEPPIFFHENNILPVLYDLGYFDCPRMWKWYVTAYGKIKFYATLRHCKIILTISNYVKNRFQDKFSFAPERIAVAYPAVKDGFGSERLSTVEEQAILQKYHLPSNGYILCLATLEPRKNLTLLVRAYAQLRQQNQISESLVLAGRKGWKIDDLLDSAENAINDIIVTGFVDDKDLPTVYRNAKLFVFPSLYEGFGLPPLEALACGTPILVSDIPVFKEIYSDMASYFRNNDLEDLKVHLLDPEVYEKSIDKKQLCQFNWQRTAEIVYSTILKTVEEV